MKPETVPPSAVQRPRFISKSGYLDGLQCRKLLWFRFNDRDRIPSPDAQQQAVFDQGTQVGELARRLYPDGIEIAPDASDLDAVLSATRQALRHRRPLFEGGFQLSGAFARMDILAPVNEDAWDLIEVKSTSNAKDIHLPDLAFQAHLLTGAGIRLRRCLLAHINRDFIRQGPIDPKEFFVLKDLTAQVSEASRQIEQQVQDMFATIRLPRHPAVAIGAHCNNPYPCPLQDLCWNFLPESNVLNLYRGSAKGLRLIREGVNELATIPDDFPLTDNQEIQRQTARSGQPHIDRPALRAFLSALRHPVAYLDFETFATAIPLLDGLKPYQQVPFQFSLHVQRSPGSALEHWSFLADGPSDPRPDFMRRLRETLPKEGSVVAYNAGFELGRLRECCEVLPEFRPWRKRVQSRVVDLLKPFRAFRYYHPDQHGSASMKAVLPALTGQGYGGLKIRDGGQASQEFLRVTFGGVSAMERARVRADLEAYCGLDTGGMARIVEALNRVTAGS